MSSYFNYTALPIFLSLEEVFSYTAARYLPLSGRFCPNWEEALFGPTMGKSVSSVFQTHFTHTTWGTTQIFIPRLLLGSRAILAFFKCTADKNSRHGIDPQLCSELKMSQTLYNSSPEYVGQLLHCQRLQLCLPFSGDCLKVGTEPAKLATAGEGASVRCYQRFFYGSSLQ